MRQNGELVRDPATRLERDDNPRIDLLVRLVKELNEARDPRKAVDMFLTTMRLLFGPWGYVGVSTSRLQPGEFRIVRRVSLEGATQMEAADHAGSPYWLPVRRGGFITEIISRGRPQDATLSAVDSFQDQRAKSDDRTLLVLRATRTAA